MLDFYFKDPMEIIDYSHLTSWRNDNPDFHLHEKFEIYFFIIRLTLGDFFAVFMQNFHNSRE